LNHTFTRELENHVIGMLLDGKANQAFNEGLALEHFNGKENVEIFEAIYTAYNAGEEIDLPNIGVKIRQDTMMHLISVNEKCPKTHNIESYIDELKKILMLRKIWLSISNVSNLIHCWAPFSPIDGIMAAVEKVSVDGIAPSIESKRTDEKAMDEWHTRVMEDRKKGGITGITTGIREIDCALNGGMKPGQLITVAARTGVGKTALATNMALNAAKEGSRVQYFSIELDRDEIIDRLVCAHAEFNTASMASREIDSYHLTHVNDAKDYIRSLPITIETSTRNSWEIVESLIRREKRLKNLKICFIDYVQQFGIKSRRMMSKREEMIAITGQAKALASELKICIVLVAQLNRNADDQPDIVPSIHDLKESGSIEQDSNAVLLLYPLTDTSRLGLSVGKNRSGKKSNVCIPADLSKNKFYTE